MNSRDTEFLAFCSAREDCLIFILCKPLNIVSNLHQGICECLNEVCIEMFLSHFADSL